MLQMTGRVIIVLLMLSNASETIRGDSEEHGLFASGYISVPLPTLNGEKPEAKWIWKSGEANPRNCYLYVRKTLTLENEVSSASAFISAHSFADVYINEKLVDRVPVNSDPQYQIYDHFDLTSYFTKGRNTIAALVHNIGVGMHHRLNARGGFFFQGQVKDAAGSVVKLNSDKSWRVQTARAWDSSTGQRHRHHLIGFREKYDARLAVPGWKSFSFDDSKWQDATEIGVPPVDVWKNIVVVSRPFLVRETIKPVNSWESKGYYVYDFGKVTTGHPQFTISGRKAGVELVFGTSERLDSDRLPTMTQGGLDYTDIYITDKGRQTWQPLTWQGFRYFAIEKNPQVKIESVSAEFRSYPVKYKGFFCCSDVLLNKCWEIGRWTVQICARDTFMDTPWREQTQYIAGDTRYDMRYANYAFGPEVEFLFKYNILSGAFSQRWKNDGSIRTRYPTDWHLGQKTSTYIPDYQLEWILSIHEYYVYYGHDSVVRQVYPNMKRLLEYFNGYVNEEHGLLVRPPGRVVLDHPDTFPMNVKGENTAMNCLYYGALNSAAWIARNIMNDNSQADVWEQRAMCIKVATNRLLFSENDGVFKDGFESSLLTQQTQVYALKYSLVPEDKKSGVVEFVKSKGRSCEKSFSYWLLYTMFSEGQGQWALDYIRTYWGGETKAKDFNGAWHEGWKSEWGSSSHAWCSGPTALLPEKVLGVEPISPGWKKFRIKPCLYDLKWATGVVSTVAGNITVKVKMVKKGKLKTGMQIEAVIPEKTLAKIYVPVRHSEKAAIYANHNKIWEHGSVLGHNDKIEYDSKLSDSVVFNIQPGKYMFHVVR